MGPEDQHEQPFEQDEYEKWLDEQATKKLARLLKGGNNDRMREVQPSDAPEKERGAIRRDGRG